MSLLSSVRFPWSARLFLTVFLAIAIIPATCVTIFLLLRYADSQSKRAEEGLQDSAAGIARAIDAEFATALTSLQILRTSGLLSGLDLGPFEQRLRNTTAETGRVFALLDAMGKPLINTVPVPRAPLAPQMSPQIAHLAEGRNSFISGVMHDPGTNEPFAFVGVRLTRSGSEILYLVTFLYSESFGDITNNAGVPDNWVVSIVDSQGVHVRRSHLNEKFQGMPLVETLVRHMERGGTGVLRTISHENIELISTVAYAPKSGWAAAVGLPVEQLEAPLKQSLEYLFMWAAIVVMFSLLALFHIARAFDRGFKAMRDSTQQLWRAESIEPHHSPIAEFADMSATMADVSRELHKHRSMLEDLVAERTDELVSEMQRRRESEAQLRQLQKMEAIGRLTGGLAHDFNNMLAVIMGALSLVQQRLARGDVDIGRFVANAMQGAESAATLTNRLLAFSRQHSAPKRSTATNLFRPCPNFCAERCPKTSKLKLSCRRGCGRFTSTPPALKAQFLTLQSTPVTRCPRGASSR